MSDPMNERIFDEHTVDVVFNATAVALLEANQDGMHPWFVRYYDEDGLTIRQGVLKYMGRSDGDVGRQPGGKRCHTFEVPKFDGESYEHILIRDNELIEVREPEEGWKF